MVILLYHHISRLSPKTLIRGLYTTPGRFEWQIKWLLSHGFQFTTFERSDPDTFFSSSSRKVILTFDDGSVSVFKNGFPILDKLGIPAVLFPISSFIDKKEITIPSSTDRTPLSFVSKDQIRKLANAGWEIGSHLHTHRPATELSDTEIGSEMKESRSILEDISEKPVITLAYPYGIYDKRTLKLASDCGYIFGLSTDCEPVGNNPLLELPRLAVKGARWHHRYYFLKDLRRELHK
jgi:peptidoglycan/xylan/chitin deacetylase (PgdA/CDA1 family)